MQRLSNPRTSAEPVPGKRIPEARYANYRRCQVFRRNGAQCKAPAEKGAHICHAHAGQLAMAVRRERERRAVLAEAVAEMRKRGRPECEMADLFTDFKGIQVTTAVMARAVITGRIDCKTAGQMVVQLQTFSKLLWQIHRKERKERKELPLIGTDNTDRRRLPNPKPLPQINADDGNLTSRRHAELWKSYLGPSFAVKAPLIQDDSLRRGEFAPRSFITPQICADERRLSKPKEMMSLLIAVPRNIYRKRTPDSEGARILPFEVSAFGDRCRAHGPPESKAA